MRENQILTKHNGFKSDRLFAPSFVSDQRTEYNYRVMSIDPSGRGADETGLCIAYSVAGRIFVKKITGIDGGYEHETLAMIAQMCSDYKIDYLVIESSGEMEAIQLLDLRGRILYSERVSGYH